MVDEHWEHSAQRLVTNGTDAEIANTKFMLGLANFLPLRAFPLAAPRGFGSDHGACNAILTTRNSVTISMSQKHRKCQNGS